MTDHIRIDRRILNWEWYTDIKMFHLFLYLLLKANYADGNWRGQNVKRGQLITGRFKVSADTGLTEMEIRTCLNKLKKTKEISMQVTNKFSIITVCKYDVYQTKEKEVNQQNNQQVTSKSTDNHPTINQQLTTIKKNKEEEEEGRGGIKNFLKANDFVCYDVEEYVNSNQIIFEKLAIATSKKPDEVKSELHFYHLWLSKNEKYPMGRGAAVSGIESWIHNSKNFKKNYHVTQPQSEKLPDANKAATKYDNYRK